MIVVKSVSTAHFFKTIVEQPEEKNSTARGENEPKGVGVVRRLKMMESSNVFEMLVVIPPANTSLFFFEFPEMMKI